MSDEESEILHELQTEIARHDLSTFMNEKEKIVQTGCPACKKAFGTVQQFKRHLTDDVLPLVIEKLSTENK